VITSFVKKNWAYIIMAVFVAAVSVFLYVEGRESGAENQEDAVRIELFDKQAFTERQDKIQKMMVDNTSFFVTMVCVNFIFVLVFLGGLLIDVLWAYYTARKKRIIKRTRQIIPAPWGVTDLLKFTLLFYTFAYILMFAQLALSNMLPVFKNRDFSVIFHASVIDTAGILFVLYFVLTVYKGRVNKLGIVFRDFFRNVLYGISGYLGIIPLLFLTLLATVLIMVYFKISTPVQPIVDMMIKQKEGALLLYMSVFAAVIGPIMEEIVFRGFMYGAFRKRLGVVWGMVVTSLVFSLLHAHPVGFVPIFILGMLLVYLYEKTGSLIPSFTVHIIHNLASIGMVFLVKYLNI